MVLSGGAGAWDLQARSSGARSCPVPAGRSGGSTSLACPRLPGRALHQRNRPSLGGIRPQAPACAPGPRREGRGERSGAAPQGLFRRLAGLGARASAVPHVLHAHTAPDAQHEALDVALVGAAHDAKVAPLAPGWAPRVGRRPVFERPSIGQRLLSPPGGRKELIPSAFRGWNPMGPFQTPLSTSLSLHLWKSAYSHPCGGGH